DFADLFFGDGLGLALQRDTFLDERVEHLAAFFLSLREGAQPGEPDLLRRILDGAGEGAVEQTAGAGLFFCHLLELLDHGVCPLVIRGRSGAAPRSRDYRTATS